MERDEAVSTRRVPVRPLDGGPASCDAVVVEEPLAVHVAGPDGPGGVLATTMRTPGDDLALAVGLCWSEGLLRAPDDLVDASRCPQGEGRHLPAEERPVLVRLRREPELGPMARRGVMSSACGVCGRQSLDDLGERLAALEGSARAADGRRSEAVTTAAVLHRLPGQLRAAQEVFGSTGGLHAVARFTGDGRLLDVAEDVGRHNAFDKLVGRAVRAGDVDWSADVVLLSGRASYELLAKAVLVRTGVVAAIGAPSSLAVDVATRFGTALVGFLRDGRGNVHSGAARLGLADHQHPVALGAGVGA